MGSLQILACTGIFALCALPVGQGIATQILEDVAGAPHSLVSIRTIDEVNAGVVHALMDGLGAILSPQYLNLSVQAIVIGGALSMSSSAFVLQLLKERGEMATRFGSATLGILLMQDIAVVPFLVLLPLVEMDSTALLQARHCPCLYSDSLLFFLPLCC